MPEAFTRRGREVPPAGVRGRGEAGPARDRGVRVLRRRGDHAHRRSHATGSGSCPTASTASGPPSEAVRKARSIYAHRRPPVRVLGGHLPAPQERPRAARRVHAPRSAPRCRTAWCSRARRDGSPTTPTPRSPTRSATGCGCSGPVHREQLFPLFAGADLYVFPSRHEGFGIPVLEAMAQGTRGAVLRHPGAARGRRRRGALRRTRRRRRLGRRAHPLLGDDAARAALVAAGNAAACAELLVGAMRARDGRGVPRGAQAGETAYRREDVDAVVGDEDGVLELRGAGAVGGGRGPAVGPDDGLDARPS